MIELGKMKQKVGETSCVIELRNAGAKFDGTHCVTELRKTKEAGKASDMA